MLHLFQRQVLIVETRNFDLLFMFSMVFLQTWSYNLISAATAFSNVSVVYFVSNSLSVT